MSKQPSTIRIGRRYRANRLSPPYDALVVGSGIGGLTTAACLARMGKKVCVLEQHYTAGGFTHSYDRNGYEWDVGVHYIGDMGSPRTMGRRLFDYITDGELTWAPMADHFDRIFLGREHFDLVAGKVEYREALIAAFPEEQQAIDTYLSYMREVRAGVRLQVLGKVLPRWVARLFENYRVRNTPAFFNRTTREVLETLTSNQKLIAVMTGQWGDNGLPPAQSSFIIHCMIAQHYMHGGYYPVGGASRMAQTIIPVIQQAGGEVFTYASVEKILVGERGVTGVRMADGNDIHAPVVISNAGVFNTFETLLDDQVPQRAAYLARLEQVQASMSSICLYIGLRDTAENLGLPKTNLWIYPSEHYEADIAAFDANPESEFPLVYVSFPSAKDPSFLDRYPGRSTIEIVAPGPHEWFEPWADQPWGKRGDDYEALKESLSQRLLQKLYEKLPQLEGKIDFYELSTSLSTDYFCRYRKGEIYGLAHTPQRFEQDWLKPKTDIRGLYLTGQDVVTCGVVGAMVGGLLTAISLGGLKGLGLARRMFL
jgi:phytoene dehydrogenase-like protein